MFSSSLKFGSSRKAVQKKMPRPTHRAIGCTFSNYGQLNYDTLYYKIMLGKHKVKLEMHFFNDQLFFFCYNFSVTLERERMDIINVLHEKYLAAPRRTLDPHTIEDTYGHCISVDSEKNLSVSYLYKESDFFEHISQVKQEEETKILTKEDVTYKQLYARL
ncbi:hypothetical protein MKJ04_04865 [Pontibacter sp. E15-1]|uniref:hypothetical protein n=1 Tax=Pontibacter sp. E15-1 TaxID=2919918 RepID=UPI001F502835|nr:hypothetical protein [Pontibacter sp. E15-1]MCJ8164163.1 hypothetical protein [Pontibacter sp. E15-1]